MFHHGLTADHTDESAITIHHRQFLELLLGEDSGPLSDMLVGRGGNDLARGDVHHLLAGERLHLEATVSSSNTTIVEPVPVETVQDS